jgi:chitodextrinase
LLLAVFQLQGQEVVAHYSFDGNTNDAVGNNTAAAKNIQLTQDRFGAAGKALLFDGAQSAITAPNSTALNSDHTTVSLWVKANSIPGQGEIYLASFGGWQERWKISLPSHGKPIWTTNATSGISDLDAGDGNELSVGTWTHLAFVHDGTKDLIYVNGALTNEKEVAGALNTTDKSLGIGFDPLSNDFSFDGAIDEVMIYNGALSAAEIAALYTAQNTAPTIDNQLVASYSFTHNLADGTTFGNNGKGTDLKYGTNAHGFGHQSAAFNGTSSTIDIDNSSQLNSDYTSIAMWVKVNALPEQGEVYLASFGGWQERWKISLPAHGKPVFTTNHENGISDMDSGDGNALVAGTWAHLVMVHDGVKNLIYMNGALAAEKEVVGKMNATTHPFGLGYNPIDGGGYFNGLLDEVKMYNYALTAEDIQTLYTTESTSELTDPISLVADFQLDGDATDATIFGNHGIANAANFTKNRFGYGASAATISEGAGIEVANSAAYNSDFTTVSMWVNVTELPGQGEVFIASFGGWQERWKVSLPSHGKPVFTTNYANGISDMDSGDGNELTVGTWTHIAFVHDGAKDKIFINGALANEKEVLGALNSTTQPLSLGYNSFGNDLYLNGSIDQFQLYNKALTDEEIANLYAAQNTAPTITETLVAYYPFSGHTNDITPFKNNASNQGAIAAKDRFGKSNKAYHFNTSAAITAANSTPLNSPQTTVSLWVNVTELPGQGEVYLASFGGWQERWKISLPSHGKPVFTTNHANGISDMDSGDGNELVPGTWTHLVMTHDGTTDKIYINGTQVAEKEVVGDLNNTSHPFGMGYDPIDKANYFNGALDEVQMYNVALSAEEVAALYAAQSVAPMDADTEAPTAPLNLTATVMNTTVNLNWNAAMDNEGVIAYNIYQDNQLIGTTANLAMTISDLAQLTMFTFGVSAVDAAGNESGITSVMLTTGEDAAPDTTAPSVPANLAINAGANSVVFSWDASTDDRAVAGYIVLVDGDFQDSLDANTTSLLINGLESETFYTFEVAAFDLAGNLSAYGEITESTTAPLETAEDGLVAHYPFEGNAEDITPYANHGVMTGEPIFETVSDRLNAGGQAIVFDGTDDNVIAPNGVHLISDFTTVSFWVRVDGQSPTDPEAYILDFGHWDERWKVSLPQHLKVVWTTNSKNTQFDKAISDMDSGDGNELIKDFWWHVTMVHDGTDDIIYVDGKEVNRKPAAGTLNSTARDLGMGFNPIEGGQYFNGALDELKIYNKALTAEEVEKLYNDGTTGFEDLSVAIQENIQVIYPNPVADELVIQHQFKGNEAVHIRIFDAMGRQMEAQQLAGKDLGNGNLILKLGNYASGFYQLNFVVDGKNIGSIPFVRVR